MVQAKKRVSYIIPTPSENVSRLRLPPLGVARLGATGPLLIPYTSGGVTREETARPKQPRHRLGISSLALDSSTQLVERVAPEGILYSGGRDGLIMSWDLGMPLRKRNLREWGSGRRPRGKWETLTGWGDDVIEEETDDDDRPTSDGDILGEVTDNLRKRRQAASLIGIPYERQWEVDTSGFEAGTKPTQFRQCAQAHTDWVNDILLCNYNQTVVSASSDGTVKGWNPHATILEDPSTIGFHSDYVRCLANCSAQKWIASGSFDRTIKLWDLNSSIKSPVLTLNPPDTTAPKSSIYALAVDPLGHTIASGSPERVVRLWDPRTGKRVGKLVGHTDNIRTILISDDSRYLLTGSADASIKLWSLDSQRCLHTFIHHTESVWSLYSDHPSLEVFYSGDKSGLVCRVDVEGCSDLSEGECVLLCNDSIETCGPVSEGINKIAVLDDNLLWTAGGTSTLKRWKIPRRRTVRPAAIDGVRIPQSSSATSFERRPPPLNIEYEPYVQPTVESPSKRLSVAPSIQSLTSERWRDRDADIKNNDLPYDSLIGLVFAKDFTHFNPRPRDIDVATLYSAASIVSIPRQDFSKKVLSPFHPSSLTSPIHSSRTEETVMFTNTARAKYEEREVAADAIAICSEPDFVIPGDAGLVRSIILNDRIHALTVDTLGEVGVWNVVRGMCLGRFLPKDVAAASLSGSEASGSGEKERSPREALEVVRERIEGEAVVSPWCMADTKAGVLTIHLMDRCFEAELYADEVGYANDPRFNDESKLNLGKWVLRNLFIGFILAELGRHQTQGEHSSGLESLENEPSKSPPAVPRPQMKSSSSSGTLICSPGMICAVAPDVQALAGSSTLLTPLIPLRTQSANINVLIPQSPNSIPTQYLPFRSGTIDTSTPAPDLASPMIGKDDYFTHTRKHSIPGGTPASPEDLSIGSGPAKAEPSTPNTPGGLMGKLRNFGRGKRPPSDTPNIPVAPTVETPSLSQSPAAVKVQETAIQKVLSGNLHPAESNDAPTSLLPTNTTILISEEGTPSHNIIYRGLVSECHKQVKALEEAMPLWLVEYLLLNQTPTVATPPKISFVLVPWNKDPGIERLPELLNTQQSKLTANRNLRVRKVLQHVQDKLEQIANESRAPSIRSSFDGQHPRNPNRPSRPHAEDTYEVLCNDTLLPLGMSLAAIRQYVWKSSTELVMYYRRRATKVPS